MLGISYFFLCGWIIISSIWPRSFERFFLAPLAASVPLIISGSAAYIFYTLDTTMIGVCLLFLFIVTLTASLTAKNQGDEIAPPSHRYKKNEIIIFLLSLVMISTSAFILTQHVTTDAVLGPWQMIPPQFFAVLFLAVLFLFFLVQNAQNPFISLMGIIALSLLVYSITLIVFPLGFGFDPFLHHATEQLILKAGFVEPKTFYYVGHYSLITILARIFSVQPGSIDSILLPFLTAITVPLLIYHALRKGFHCESRIACTGVLLGLSIPFTYATTTTPWTFAYTIMIFLVLSSMIFSQKRISHLIICGALGLATLCVHPLAGLPALGFCILFFLRSYQTQRNISKRMFRILQLCFIVMFSISVVAAFLLNSVISNQLLITLTFPTISSLFDFFSVFVPSFETRYLYTLDTVYFFEKNGVLILSLLAISGVFLLLREKKMSSYIPYIQGWCIAILNAFFLKEMVEFTSLITYERSEYAERLISLSFVFLIPFIMYALAEGIRWILFHAKEPLTRFTFSLTAVALILISTYLSYPRNDAFASFHGFNVSKADIETVKRIDQDAGYEQFIVLANQVVSSAAIKEFGFKQYYPFTHGDTPQSVFYYPIPTSSPLHEYYSTMRKNPSKKIIQKAMELVNVRRAYFVVNSYDERFPIIISIAKKEADSFFEIDHGKNVVFVYIKH